MPKQVKVQMPLWWTDGKEVYGYTDGVDTFCCCTTAAWFVEVPEFDYSGYFNVSDLRVVA